MWIETEARCQGPATRRDSHRMASWMYKFRSVSVTVTWKFQSLRKKRFGLETCVAFVSTKFFQNIFRSGEVQRGSLGFREPMKATLTKIAWPKGKFVGSTITKMGLAALGFFFMSTEERAEWFHILVAWIWRSFKVRNKKLECSMSLCNNT